MSPTTVVVSGAGTAVELSAVAVMLQSREGGQKKLVKKAIPWLPYMGVAQTNLPIEAMLKFEFVSIMTPSNTGLGSMFWRRRTLFENFPTQKNRSDIWILGIEFVHKNAPYLLPMAVKTRYRFSGKRDRTSSINSVRSVR